MFWKLHGWIDNVWEKYRRAKSMSSTDPKLTEDLVAQCREMDTEIQEHSWLYLKASGKAAAAGCTPSSTAQCITATIPPSSSGLPSLSASELETLRRWIADGAPGPD